MPGVLFKYMENRCININWHKICNKMGKKNRRFFRGARPETFRKGVKHMEENNNKATVEGVEPEDAVVIDEVNPTPKAGEEAENVVAEGADEALSEDNKLQKEVEDLQAKLEKEKQEYMFLMAEFDNFRKRTLREKSELIKNGAESAFKGLLPVVDDIERAIKAGENTEDASALKEGMELIYKKLKKYMEQNGVKEMDQTDRVFDADRHEAISAVPVPDENEKGKILDTIEKGYTINDKVLRHAKVVVGQ